MDSGLQGSLQLLVMANEYIGFLRAATRGVPVDEETLALDMVEELGPTGDYLQHPHTMRHVRDPFYSGLMHKGLYAQWEKQGQKTMEQLAAEKVDQILEAHTVAPLAENIQENISDIVARELEWIGSKAGD
jgi:trimethylamine--corrinoid protein Co-methyltransferase